MNVTNSVTIRFYTAADAGTLRTIFQSAGRGAEGEATLLRTFGQHDSKLIHSERLQTVYLYNRHCRIGVQRLPL